MQFLVNCIVRYLYMKGIMNNTWRSQLRNTQPCNWAHLDTLTLLLSVLSPNGRTVEGDCQCPLKADDDLRQSRDPIMYCSLPIVQCRWGVLIRSYSRWYQPVGGSTDRPMVTSLRRWGSLYSISNFMKSSYLLAPRDIMRPYTATTQMVWLWSKF